MQKVLTDEELEALLERFTPGRHPKIAAALRELQDLRRAGVALERGVILKAIGPAIRATPERHGQIVFDDLRHPDVARFRAARLSGERIEIDLHALGLSDAPDVVAVRVVEQLPWTWASGKVGVVFSVTTAAE